MSERRADHQESTSTIELPDVCLVALVGVSGSGKSTFAARHFRPTQVVSSDACRAQVSDDENDQSANADAFDLLHHAAGLRLKRFRFTVVDATNVQPGARQQLVSLARAHDVLPVALVLDLPLDVCAERTAARGDREVPAHALRRQHRELRRSLRSLEREGFRHVRVLRTEEEVAAATVAYTRLWTDRTELTGPFDVIGDVHGCRAELEALLDRLGYAITRDAEGRPIGAHHPDGRTAVFVGDLVDRGPDVVGVLRLTMGMVRDGDALAVPGNHEEKLIRALRGRQVQAKHGLAETLEQLDAEPAAFRAEVLDFCAGLVSHLVLDGGRLVVAHAGLKEAYHGRSSQRVRAFCLYGDTTGETDAYGLPVRYPWADDYRGAATVLYGHVPTTEAVWVNNTMCLDTGCVFGGTLTALRYPERELVSVPAERVWYEPAKPLSPPASTPAGSAVAPGAARSEPDVLDLTDVLGDPGSPAGSGVATAYHGRVAVRPPNAAAALEVMSRFAIDPHLLLYLPPTMAPAATSQRDGLLEHPAEAFAAYAGDGITDLVAEEKHMGSRAVLLLARSETVLAQRFGATGAVCGVAYTRTGRSFFGPALTADLVGRLRDAAGTAGLWDELGADWLLLDAEIVPWSVKADGLLRSQYAPVAASGRAVLAAAGEVLAAAAARGVEVGDLLARTRARAGDVDAYADAYGRYCWPTSGLTGVQVAPFQLLASGTAGGEGATYHDRPHAWHLALASRLARAAPDLVRETRSYAVDTTSPASVDAATAWWEALTADGGEGMVVKPAANLVRAAAGGRPVQPGVKCRGRDYLRVVYGPEYTEPDNLRRLRDRGLGHKRSLALREYALGLEALDRVARGEPLWRVHQPVFAVLALESEPVDPRL